MDGKTVQRMQSLATSNTELREQNVTLSVRALEMQARIDALVKARAIDNLLNAVLLRSLGGRLESSIANVDAIRSEISAPPSLTVDVAKDVERGVWVIQLKEGTMQTDDAPKIELVRV